MTEFKFNKGDRIKLNETGGWANNEAVPEGTEGVIVRVPGSGGTGEPWYSVEFEDYETNLYSASEMELVDYGSPNTTLIHAELAPDMVNDPPHYKQYGCEVIEITEHMTFNAGNAVKYIARSPFKGNQIQDLEKAQWYLEREIARLKKGAE